MGVKTRKLGNINDSLIQWQAVTVADGSTTLNAEAGKGYFLDTNAGVIEVFLPASPSIGDTFVFADYSGTFATNRVLINTRGTNIDSTVPVGEFRLDTNNLDIQRPEGSVIDLEEMTGFVLSLPLDQQLLAFYYIHQHRVDLTNVFYERMVKDHDFSDLQSDSRQSFQDKLADKLASWVLDHNAPLESVRPYFFLALLDSDDPCTVISLSLDKLESIMDRSVTGRVSDKATLMRFIKLSYLIASIPDYPEYYDESFQYLLDRFYDTFIILERGPLRSVILQLPQFFLIQLVLVVNEKLSSLETVEQQFAQTLWDSFISISNSGCDTLTVALSSELLESSRGKEL